MVMRYRDESIPFLDLSFEDKLYRLHHKVLMQEELNKNEIDLLGGLLEVLVGVETGDPGTECYIGGGIKFVKEP